MVDISLNLLGLGTSRTEEGTPGASENHRVPLNKGSGAYVT